MNDGFRDISHKLYFLFKESFNEYLNGIIKREQVSNIQNKNLSLLFQIYKTLNEKQIKINSINKINIFDIIQNKIQAIN